VVYAVSDPNPKAQGGADRLRHAGINVQEGIFAKEAANVNERFLVAMRTQRPFVMVKAAMSLDGRISLPSGESQWITGSSARYEGRKLRGEMGSVLVGPGTVLADDPHLTAVDSETGAYFTGMRADEYGVVTRVVLDPRTELPPAARVFDDAAPTLHVVPEHGKPTRAEVGSSLRLPLQDGRFPIPLLLERLFELGHTGVLVEGGGRTIGSFFQAGCVDAIELFVAPKVLGSGTSWVEAFEIEGLSAAPEFKVRSVERVGEDLHLSLRKAISSPPLPGEDLPRPRG
jgi:diaminohydroxyphosphoribosylaminopyrimidine deaminase/5-amino-6-(5-phosphoribosylamino)uracil reductase